MPATALAVDSKGTTYAIGSVGNGGFGTIFFKRPGFNVIAAYGGQTQVLSVAIAEDGSGGIDGVYGVAETYLAYWNGASFSQGTVPSGYTGTFSAVGATRARVVIGTTTGEVWYAQTTNGVPEGTWTQVTGLELNSEVVDFSNMYDKIEVIVGVTSGGAIFSTQDQCANWEVNHTSAVQFETVATSFNNGQVHVAAGGNTTLVVNEDLLTPNLSWNELVVTGLALTIKGLAFQGVTGRLFMAEGTTDVFAISKTSLFSAGGSISASLVQSLSYNVTEAESINRTVGLCGNIANSLYYSTLI
jgi:hypothetical protein